MMKKDIEWLKLRFNDGGVYTGKYVKFIIDKYGIGEPMYHALIKGHELVDDYDIYWNYNKSDHDVFVSRLHPPLDNFSTEMTKAEWNNLGINDSNADFVEAKG